MRTVLLVLLAWSSAVAGPGSKAPALPATRTAAHPAALAAARTSAHPAARSDAEIEKAIRQKLAASKIGKDNFQVRVQGGVATLEGRTDVIQHKGVATRLARSGGAATVNNRIQISQAARDHAMANLEKGRRRVQVRRGEPRTAERAEVSKR